MTDKIEPIDEKDYEAKFQLLLKEAKDPQVLAFLLKMYKIHCEIRNDPEFRKIIEEQGEI